MARQSQSRTLPGSRTWRRAAAILLAVFVCAPLDDRVVAAAELPDTIPDRDFTPIEHEFGAVPLQHELPVQSIGWLDDGKSLLTTCRDGLRIWDVSSNKTVHEVVGPLENWRYAASDRSGRRIALTGSQSGTKVLDWPSGKVLVEIPEIRGVALALSPDGKKLAVASRKREREGTLHFIDIDTAEVLAERIGAPALALAWSPDGRYLAAGENRGIVIFLKPDGTLLRPGIRLDPPDPLVALAFDDEGARLAIVTIGGTTGVWTTADRKPVWSWTSPIPGHNIVFSSALGGAVFINDGQRLAVRSSRTSMVFEAATGKVASQEDLDIPGGYANIALSPDGKRLARSTGRCAVDIVDSATLQSTLARDVAYPYFTRALRLSPDQKTLLAIGPKRIDFWNIEPLRHLGGLALASYCDHACWSPDSRLVAAARQRSAGTTAGVEIVDAREHKVLHTVPIEDFAPRGIAFTPDGRRLAVAEVRHLSLWDVASSTREWRAPACEVDDWLEKLAISPNGKQFAAIVRFRKGRPAKIPADAAWGGVHLYSAADGHDLGELVTAGTPKCLEFLDDSILLAGMTPPVSDNPKFPVLVEWDVLGLQLNPDRSLAFLREGKDGEVASLYAQRHRALIVYDEPFVPVCEIGLFDLEALREIRQVTLRGALSACELLPDNRIAIAKPNGNVLIVKARPSDANEGKSSD